MVKKIFRWQGLVAFFAITGGLLLFFMLFAGNLVKKSIEVTGTRLVGARVEVGDVNLSFFPAKIEIFNMQVTNPEAPMTNAAETDRLAFSMNLMGLLQRKVDINEMAVTGVRFNTVRKKSGAIKKHPSEKETRDDPAGKEPRRFQLPSFDVTDVQTILKKESLQSLEEIESLKNELTEKKENFQAQLETLPDKEKLAEYEARIKALQEKRGLTGIMGGIKEVNDLQNEIRADMARLQKLRQEVAAGTRTLETRLKAVAVSPQHDVKRLKDKYSLSPQGAGNMTALLFGPKYQNWVETGLAWYRKLQPVITRARQREAEETVARPVRGRGITVRFRDKAGSPYFLIRLADISIETGLGNISGTIKNITTEQPLLGLPLSYRFSSEKMKDLERLEIYGQLDHTIPGQSRDTLNINARGIQINNFQISRGEDFPLTLDKGLAECRVKAAVENNIIESEADFSVFRTQFSLNRETGPNQIEQAVVTALADVSRISLSAAVDGPLNDYDVKISSNLDNVIKKAVSRVVAETARVFEDRLRNAIAKKTDGPLNDLRAGIKGFDGIEKELTERLNIAQKALSINSTAPSLKLRL